MSIQRKNASKYLSALKRNPSTQLFEITIDHIKYEMSYELMNKLKWHNGDIALWYDQLPAEYKNRVTRSRTS